MSIDPDTGADPTPVPEGAWPTPGQWVHTFLSLGPELRLATAARILDTALELEMHDLRRTGPVGYFTAPDADGSAALWAGEPTDWAPRLALSSRDVDDELWTWLHGCFPVAPSEAERVPHVEPHPFVPGQDGSPAHYAGTCAHLTGHGYCAEHRDAAVHQ